MQKKRDIPTPLDMTNSGDELPGVIAQRRVFLPGGLETAAPWNHLPRKNLE